MKSISSCTRRIRPSRIALSLALGVVLAMAGVRSIQAADLHGRGGAAGRGHAAAGARDWRGHQEHARRDWNGSGYGPGVVYAPPVVYSPPPAYAAPGFNLILPLNIR